MATAGGAAAAGYDVFLSHKSEYKPWVEWLGRSLQQELIAVDDVDYLLRNMLTAPQA